MEAQDATLSEEAKERNLFKAIDLVSKSLDGDLIVGLVKQVLNPEFVSVSIEGEPPEKLDEGMLNRATDNLFDVISIVFEVLKVNYTELFTRGRTLIGAETIVHGNSIGVLREDFVEELIIWRPIMEHLVSIGEVKSGEVDLIDLMKLNALLDMKAAMEKRAMDKAQRG